MIGDVIGNPGLGVLERCLPSFIKDQSVDFTVINGENSAGGFGMTEESLNRLLACGADIVTSGNHIWEKREFWPLLDSNDRILRPANYPEGTNGRGFTRINKILGDGKNYSFVVINLQGREYMTPINCPFLCFDSIKTEADDIVLVDFHAESNKEKESLGFYAGNRCAVIAGTHTHVQTADERIMPGGSAYITDIGMTGISDGVIGMDKNICLNRVINQVLYRMEAASEKTETKASIQGIIAQIDKTSFKALSVKRFTCTS